MTGEITGSGEPNQTTTARDPNDPATYFVGNLGARLGAAWLTYILFFYSWAAVVVRLGAPDKPHSWPQFLAWIFTLIAFGLKPWNGLKAIGMSFLVLFAAGPLGLLLVAYEVFSGTYTGQPHPVPIAMFAMAVILPLSFILACFHFSMKKAGDKSVLGRLAEHPIFILVGFLIGVLGLMLTIWPDFARQLR